MLFALIYNAIVDPALRDIRRFIPEFAGMKAGDRVLDVCCGTGDQAFHYTGRGIDAVGIDHDPRMIKVAERNRKKHGPACASFQVANAENLPFKEESFSFVSVALALHEKDRASRDTVISEMKRVVKKGGALVFIDFAVPLPRNSYGLLVRFIEFFAGRDHFKCSRDYLRQGGLDVLLGKNNLREDKRHYLKYGTIVVIKTGKGQGFI